MLKKLLRETLLKESLTPQEKNIFNDLVSENIDEAVNFDVMVNKFSNYAKKGAITAGILISLMSSNALAQEQKQELLNVAKTEVSDDVYNETKAYLKKATGLEFNDVGMKKLEVEPIGGKAFDLPSQDSIMKAIGDNNVPTQFLDNIYINYFKGYDGKEAGAYINIRLKDENEFQRLSQHSFKTKIYKMIINGVLNFRKQNGFVDKKGSNYPIIVKVMDHKGTVINGSPVKFNN